jgi:hypothetical protein
MGWRVRVLFPKAQDLSLVHSTQTDSGIHPAPLQWVAGVLPREVKLITAQSSDEGKKGRACLHILISTFKARLASSMLKLEIQEKMKSY